MKPWNSVDATDDESKRSQQLPHGNRHTPLSLRVVKNTTIVLLGQIFVLAANLGVTVLLARHLGKFGFGLLAYSMAFIGFFATIGDFGLGPILVRELSRAPQRYGEILGNVILVKLVLNFVAVILAIVTAAFLDFSPELRAVIWIFSISILISSKLKAFRPIFESTYEARLAMEYPMVFQTVDALVLIALTLILIRLNASIQTLTIAYVISSLPGFLMTVIGMWRSVKIDFQFDRELCRSLLRGSLPILFYVILTTFYERVDVLMVKAWLGEATVGLYASAFRLVSPLTFIPTAVSLSLFPLMSQFNTNSKQNLARTYLVGIKTLATIGIPIALGVSIVGRGVFRLLYTETFWPAEQVFVVLTWAQAILFLNFFYANLNISMDNQRYNVWAASVMCLGVAAFNLVLIPKWGIMGAGAAKMLATLLGFIIFHYLAHRELDVNVFPIAARLLLAAIALAVWLIAVRNLNLIIVIVTSAAIYPLLLSVFEVFNKDEKRMLINLVRRFA